MKHRITFEVPGKIQPWQRTGPGRHTRDASRAYKKAVAGLGLVARMDWERTHRDRWPQDREYLLGIETVSRNRRRLDISNVRKQVEDALSGVLYGDDSQIWAEAGRRRVDEHNEHLVVTVEVLDGQVDTAEGS